MQMFMKSLFYIKKKKQPCTTNLDCIKDTCYLIKLCFLWIQNKLQHYAVYQNTILLYCSLTDLKETKLN